MPGFFKELKRRNVVRAGIAYILLAWLALQIAEVFLPVLGAPDWVFNTLLFLVALGFPFMLIFSWAFEITPEGVRKTRDVDLDESITVSTGRKIDFVIIGALVVALGYFVWESRLSGEPETVAEAPVEETTEPDSRPQEVSRSIAVLPFDDLSAEGDQQWFADGLAEEILNALARAPDLLVTARNSSFAYRDAESVGIQAIGEALGVDHVLEGSVRRGPDRLRVTAQLIRAADGFHLWSQNYDRTPDDMIEIQEDVAIEIAKALQTAMDPEALAAMMAAGTSSVPAYESYLRGIAYGLDTQNTGDMYEYNAVIEALDHAIELDPEFTQAHWQLAYFFDEMLDPTTFAYGIMELPEDELRDRFEDAIQSAIRYEDDPASLAKYRAFEARHRGRMGQSLRYAAEYLSARPNDIEAQFEMMNTLVKLGHLDEFRTRVDEFLTISPHNSFVRTESIWRSIHLDDDEFTRELIRSALEFEPDSIFAKYQAHRSLLWLGDIDNASRFLPALRNSDYPETSHQVIEVRQACAENRLEDANRRISAMLAQEDLDLWTRWYLLLMSDREADAEALLRPFEEAGDYATLYEFASYAFFNVSAYPEFAAHRELEGGITHEVRRIPFRCRFPETAAD